MKPALLVRYILVGALISALSANGATLAVAAAGSAGTSAPASSVEPSPSGKLAVEGALDITNLDNLVSINYSLWFNPVVPKSGGAIYDVAKILEDAASSQTAPAWGPLHNFHYWAEPEAGYYRSDDTAVIRRHMAQLEEAGVDFFIVDNTNASSTWDPAYYNDIFLEPAQVMLDTMLAMREEGLRTPHIVFWTGSWGHDPSPAFSGEGIYERFYAGGKYDSLFVTFEEKPLLLVTDTQPASLEGKFTMRKMWGLQPSLAEKEWSFLQPHPQNVGLNGEQAEQLSVSTAYQATYISNYETATPRRGGITFAAQWERAFAERPKIVTLTWWNEWIAQRFEDEAGKTRFVDNYTFEYSRDIEPAADGHGDTYYQFMKQYIAAYKAGQPFPRGLVQDAVDLGSFETGDEAWKAGANIAESAVYFSEQAPGVPAAYEGGKLLGNTSTAAAGEAWRTVFQQFERPVDFSEFLQLRLAFYHNGGATGVTAATATTATTTATAVTDATDAIDATTTNAASDYEVRIKLVSSSGDELEKTFSVAPGQWEQLAVDYRAWEGRTEVERIEVSLRAVGSGDAWTGQFYVDQVELVDKGHSLGSFELGADGWEAGANTDSVATVSAGEEHSPANAYQGSRALVANGGPAEGWRARTVKKEFAEPQNWSSYSTFKVAVGGWGGAPGAQGYLATITVVADNGEKLTRMSPLINPAGWQEIALQFGSWAHKDKVKSVEVGYIAFGGNEPWAGKFFIDGATVRP